MKLAALAVAGQRARCAAGVKVETTTLTDDTTPGVAAEPEPDLAGYEIVCRETHRSRLAAHDPGRGT